MNKLLSIATTAALVVGLSLSVSGAARADSAGDAAAGAFVGGVLGFMAGSAAAGGGPVVVHHHHHMSDWEQHVQDCEDAYGWRYNPDTDMVRHHGYSSYCDL